MSPSPSPGRLPARALLLGACAAALALPAAAAPARARPSPEVEQVRRALDEQARRLEAQQRMLEAQARLIEEQKAQIAALKTDQDKVLDSIRAAGLGPSRGASPVIQLAQTDTTQRAQDIQGDPGQRITRPVGEAPPESPNPVSAALPQEASVLTPRGHGVIDPSLEYDRSSSNRLVFRGVEIVPGVNLGLVDANSAERDTGVASLGVRYGLTRRIEVEARIPYVYRHDQLTVLAQQVTNALPPINQTQSLTGNGIGDVELAARYQLNNPRAGGPFFIAGVRVKSRTGLGPYDVAFDSNGITRTLATGSGFWGVEPNITMLLPSDPVVIFATLGYLDNVGRDINRDLPSSGGTGSAAVTHIGKAEPGDAINASVGFGFALNERFSFSLGYSHSYVMGSRIMLNNTVQKSNGLQVGAMSMGWSYRLRPNLTINNSFEFGVTSDAPNLRIVTRLPVSF